MKVSQFLGKALLAGADMESEVTVVLATGEILTVRDVTCSGNELVVHTNLYVGAAKHISILPREAHRMTSGGACSCGFRGNVLGHLNWWIEQERNNADRSKDEDLTSDNNFEI